MQEASGIKAKGIRPRIKHEYGDGYVLSITLEDTDPAALSALLKELQSGYVKIILKKD